MPGIKQLGVLLVLFSSYFPLKVAWGTYISWGKCPAPALSDSPAVSILTERYYTKTYERGPRGEDGQRLNCTFTCKSCVDDFTLMV